VSAPEDDAIDIFENPTSSSDAAELCFPIKAKDGNFVMICL